MFRRAYQRDMFEGSMWGQGAHRAVPDDFFRAPDWQVGDAILDRRDTGEYATDIAKNLMTPLPFVVRTIMSGDTDTIEGTEMEEVVMELSRMGFQESVIRSFTDLSENEYKRIKQRLWKREKDLRTGHPEKPATKLLSEQMGLAKAGYDEKASQKVLDDILGAFVMGDIRTQWHVAKELGFDPEYVEMMITHGMSDEQLTVINDHRASKGLGPIERLPYDPELVHPEDKTPYEPSLDTVERVGGHRLRGLSVKQMHQRHMGFPADPAGFKSDTQTDDYLKRYMFRHPYISMQTGHYNPALWDQVRRVGNMSFKKHYSPEEVKAEADLTDWDLATSIRYYLEGRDPEERAKEMAKRHGPGMTGKFLKPFGQR